MMRQKMMTINDAYIEAAVIDGASMWRIFFKIILPMSGSAMATPAILTFMDMWNDYLLPLVLLSERSKFTLPLLLSTLSEASTRISTTRQWLARNFDYSDSDRLYFCAEVFQRRPYGWRRERIKVYD